MGIFYDLAIDLGTAYTLLYIPQLDILYREPTFLAVNRRTGQLVATGEEAKKMKGFTPGHIEVLQPMKDGVVVDFDQISTFIRTIIQKALGGKKHYFLRTVMVCLPWGATDMEKRAYMNQLDLPGGISHFYLVPEPFAAALGAGYTLTENQGILMVDIGGGTTEIALISLGGIVKCISLKDAGNRMDEGIRDFLELHFQFSIGLNIAEDIKKNYGSVYPVFQDFEFDLKGFHRSYRLPLAIRFNTRDLRVAMEPTVTRIIKGIETLFEHMTPELATDIAQNGLTMVGGGASLKGWERRLNDHFRIPANICEEPYLCVIKGMEKVLRNLKNYKHLFID
jgi:rod shape-determining protein MreB